MKYVKRPFFASIFLYDYVCIPLMICIYMYIYSIYIYIWSSCTKLFGSSSYFLFLYFLGTSSSLNYGRIWLGKGKGTRGIRLHCTFTFCWLLFFSVESLYWNLMSVMYMQVLEECKVSREIDRETLIQVARTSLRTKVHTELADLLTEVGFWNPTNYICTSGNAW